MENRDLNFQIMKVHFSAIFFFFIIFTSYVVLYKLRIDNIIHSSIGVAYYYYFIYIYQEIYVF